MSLDFQYFGNEDTTKWDEQDWKNYNSLVWFTVVADIGYLCEESAEEFCRRVNALGASINELKAEELTKFYGLSTNVETLTARQWAIKHFAERNTCGSAWVTKVRAEGLKGRKVPFAG